MAPDFGSFKRIADFELALLPDEQLGPVLIERLENTLETIIATSKYWKNKTVTSEMEAGIFDLHFNTGQAERMSMVHVMVSCDEVQVTIEEACHFQMLRQPGEIRRYADYLLFRLRRAIDERAWHLMRDQNRADAQGDSLARQRAKLGGLDA